MISKQTKDELTCVLRTGRFTASIPDWLKTTLYEMDLVKYVDGELVLTTKGKSELGMIEG